MALWYQWRLDDKWRHDLNGVMISMASRYQWRYQVDAIASLGKQRPCNKRRFIVWRPFLSPRIFIIIDCVYLDLSRGSSPKDLFLMRSRSICSERLMKFWCSARSARDRHVFSAVLFTVNWFTDPQKNEKIWRLTDCPYRDCHKGGACRFFRDSHRASARIN